jgi:hypothetical protein
MSRIKSWSEWLYRQNWGLTRTECNNSRKALRLTEFKYELKLPATVKGAHQSTGETQLQQIADHASRRTQNNRSSILIKHPLLHQVLQPRL